MTAKTILCNVWLSLLFWGYVETAGFDFVARMNEVLKNDTSIKLYADCFLDRGPCAADGRALKRVLPEFIATSCGRCSRRQKQASCKVLFMMHQDKYEEMWGEFLNKYDPEEIHRSNLTEYLDFCTDEFQMQLPKINFQ